MAVGDGEDDGLVASLLESIINSYSICVQSVVGLEQLQEARLARHLVVVCGSSAVGDAVGRLRSRGGGGGGLAGVLVGAAPLDSDRPLLLDRLPAPLYFLSSQPTAIRQLEKEWQEMQSVTIPRLPPNAWFIQHAMDQLGCRLFNFTSPRHKERRPICRDFE